jgi:hypothetical protein
MIKNFFYRSAFNAGWMWLGYLFLRRMYWTKVRVAWKGVYDA